VKNEGGGSGSSYGAKINLITATEQSVNTAYIDMTASMDNGPKKIAAMATALGVDTKKYGIKPTSGSPWVPSGSACWTWPTGTRRSPTPAWRTRGTSWRR
jgi:hypothetical protein